MKKKIVRQVTVTGADDSVRPADLRKIQKEYPFAEFGILLSKKQEGTKRFPSFEWLKDLWQIYSKDAHFPHTFFFLKLSGHLCGRWVRELCQGNDIFFQERSEIEMMFGRLQLNFHAEPHEVALDKFRAILYRRSWPNRTFIFQLDGANEGIFKLAQEWPEINTLPLFDLSGGTGLLPQRWPRNLEGYCGYAGGLSPENLQEEMEKIASVVEKSPIWIDAETHLRSQADTVFDLDKVSRFLEIAKPWVI